MGLYALKCLLSYSLFVCFTTLFNVTFTKKNIYSFHIYYKVKNPYHIAHSTMTDWGK